MTQQEKAAALLALHEDPELLVLVNAWDVASAKKLAGQPGCKAIATASAAISAMYGYPDGEEIPLDLMLDMTTRIAGAVELPVTADLEAGYGDVGETVRRAIAAGAVGGNLEDEMRPLDEAVANVRSAIEAAEAEGVAFVLNARTDAFLFAEDGDDPEQVLADAIERGKAFLEAGAALRLHARLAGRGHDRQARRSPGAAQAQPARLPRHAAAGRARRAGGGPPLLRAVPPARGARRPRRAGHQPAGGRDATRVRELGPAPGPSRGRRRSRGRRSGRAAPA